MIYCVLAHLQSAAPRVSVIPSRQLASVAGRAVASSLLRASTAAHAVRRTPFHPLAMRAMFSTGGDAAAAPVRLPVTAFSEAEAELRESVAAFAKKVIAPKVREMDSASKLDAGVLKALFEQGMAQRFDSCNIASYSVVHHRILTLVCVFDCVRMLLRCRSDGR
jgi:hypothetical protein